MLDILRKSCALWFLTSQLLFCTGHLADRPGDCAVVLLPDREITIFESRVSAKEKAALTADANFGQVLNFLHILFSPEGRTKQKPSLQLFHIPALGLPILFHMLGHFGLG